MTHQHHTKQRALLLNITRAKTMLDLNNPNSTTILNRISNKIKTTTRTPIRIITTQNFRLTARAS
jgi:hypothetical protein